MFLQFNPEGRTIINDYQRRSNAVQNVLQNVHEKGPVTLHKKTFIQIFIFFVKLRLKVISHIKRQTSREDPEIGVVDNGLAHHPKTLNFFGL